MTDFVALKEKIRQHYADRYRDLDAEMRAELEAVEQFESIERRYEGGSPERADLVILNACPDAGEGRADEVDGGTDDESRGRRGELTTAIKEAVSELDDGFSFHDVRRVLDRISPELSARSKNNALTQVLRKLETKGVISLLVEGKGKRASTYQKVTSSDPADRQERLERMFNVN